MLLDGELHGKLGDFRLARCSKHEQDFQTTHEAGTLGYIAPELPRRDKPTPRTDIYAFGALCSEVACGGRLVGQKKPCGMDDSGGLGLLETFPARSQLYIYCIFTLKAVNSFQNYYNYKFILYFYLKKNM